MLGAYVKLAESETEGSLIVMSTFACPKCKTEHDIGDYPDHMTDMRGNSFEFTCDCGEVFDVGVEWEPSFYVKKQGAFS